MASAGSGATTGAVTGAGAGASFGAVGGPIGMGWGAAIGAGVGLIGGYFGGIAARKKEREQERLEEKILNMLGVKKYTKFYNQYLPIIRSQIAAGAGPALEQGIARTISSKGLTGTGLGEILRNLAPVATGIAAQGQAGAMARNTQLDKARALGAQISRRADVPVTNPLLDALSGMASGGFAGAELDRAARGGFSFNRTNKLFTEQVPLEGENLWLPSIPGN